MKSDADHAMEISVEAAELAVKASKSAAEQTDALKPDPRQGILGDLARQEQSALLRFGPKRNRWRDLERFEQRLVEIEQRRAHRQERQQVLVAEREAEPDRYSAVLADWIAAGEKGDKPVSRLEELDRQIAEAQAEYEALGVNYERLLQERAEHIAANRDCMGADVTKAIEEAKADHARLVDELEAKRQELLDLRATQVWVALCPHQTLANEPATSNLVGGRKAAQDVHLPGVPMALSALGVFNLLRADGRFATTVSTVDQAAAIEGVSGERLTGRNAIWDGSDEDFERQRREKEAHRGVPTRVGHATAGVRMSWGVNADPTSFPANSARTLCAPPNPLFFEGADETGDSRPTRRASS